MWSRESQLVEQWKSLRNEVRVMSKKSCSFRCLCWSVKILFSGGRQQRPTALDSKPLRGHLIDPSAVKKLPRLKTVIKNRRLKWNGRTYRRNFSSETIFSVFDESPQKNCLKIKLNFLGFYFFEASPSFFCCHRKEDSKVATKQKLIHFLYSLIFNVFQQSLR